MEKGYYEKRARGLFHEGYNCAQAVFLAFSDLYQIDSETAAKLSSSFGGGIGRLREVCGAVSGMAMVTGTLYGYSDPQAGEEKSTHYERIQRLAKEFEAENGTIICRELLGLGKGSDDPKPEERTAAYYQKRPCEDFVGIAASILQRYIEEQEDAAEKGR